MIEIVKCGILLKCCYSLQRVCVYVCSSIFDGGVDINHDEAMKSLVGRNPPPPPPTAIRILDAWTENHKYILLWESI